uniref:DUF3549 family protein n=1 Tax=Thaumasiovibrio occultus TaxID=1891184 RepID=UPI000B35E51D|nr:DUF3549 family protein [Thaumasiovibrio occultus]
MTTLHHLSQLLLQAQCHYAVYDLGRRVTQIPNEMFLAIEENRQPYPYPMRQQAQLAIAFSRDDEPPFIWLLKFPLDERGLLKQAAVGDFIRFVAEAMGANITDHLSDEQQKTLAQNPYIFKPAEEKLAMLHAKLADSFQHAPSRFYAEVRDYFTLGETESRWQQLGIQGFADVAARINQDNNASLIANALPTLPVNPMMALLVCLEHVALPDNVAAVLKQQLTEALQQDTIDATQCAVLLRGLAGAPQLETILATVLSHPLANVETLLIAIAGRNWHGLRDDTLLLYLCRLAENGDQALFNSLFADLVMVPALRCHILPLLHQPLPDTLKQALMNMQANLH